MVQGAVRAVLLVRRVVAARWRVRADAAVRGPVRGAGAVLAGHQAAVVAV